MVSRGFSCGQEGKVMGDACNTFLARSRTERKALADMV